LLKWLKCRVQTVIVAIPVPESNDTLSIDGKGPFGPHFAFTTSHVFVW
jgi:hypothetical protein